MKYIELRRDREVLAERAVGAGDGAAAVKVKGQVKGPREVGYDVGFYDLAHLNHAARRRDGPRRPRGCQTEAEPILSRTRDIEADGPPIIETFRVFAYRRNLAAHGPAIHDVRRKQFFLTHRQLTLELVDRARILGILRCFHKP